MTYEMFLPSQNKTNISHYICVLRTSFPYCKFIDRNFDGKGEGGGVTTSNNPSTCSYKSSGWTCHAC